MENQIDSSMDSIQVLDPQAVIKAGGKLKWSAISLVFGVVFSLLAVVVELDYKATALFSLWFFGLFVYGIYTAGTTIEGSIKR